MDFRDAEGAALDGGNPQPQGECGIAGDEADADAQHPQGRAPAIAESLGDLSQPGLLI